MNSTPTRPITPTKPHSIFATSPGKSWLLRDYESRLNKLRNAVEKSGQSLETPRRLPKTRQSTGTPNIPMQTAMFHLTDALSGNGTGTPNGKSIDENMDECLKKLQEALAVIRAPLTPRTASPATRPTKQRSTPLTRTNLNSLLERVVSASTTGSESPHSPTSSGNIFSPLDQSPHRVNKKLDLSSAWQSDEISSKENVSNGSLMQSNSIGRRTQHMSGSTNNHENVGNGGLSSSDSGYNGGFAASNGGNGGGNGGFAGSGNGGGWSGNGGGSGGFAGLGIGGGNGGLSGNGGGNGGFTGSGNGGGHVGLSGNGGGNGGLAGSGNGGGNGGLSGNGGGNGGFTGSGNGGGNGGLSGNGGGNDVPGSGNGDGGNGEYQTRGRISAGEAGATKAMLRATSPIQNIKTISKESDKKPPLEPTKSPLKKSPPKPIQTSLPVPITNNTTTEHPTISSQEETKSKIELPSKYANMLKMGVPMAAVRIKMMADGVGDLAPPLEESETKVACTRRQRLAWQTVDGGRRRNSIWHQDSPINSPKANEDGSYDSPTNGSSNSLSSNKNKSGSGSGSSNKNFLSPEALEEFEKHWTKRAEIPKKKSKQDSSNKKKSKAKTYIIDSKRAMNASIALARMIRSQGGIKIAQAINDLNYKDFSYENLLSMLEFAPTKLEIVKFKHFISTNKKLLLQKSQSISGSSSDNNSISGDQLPIQSPDSNSTNEENIKNTKVKTITPREGRSGGGLGGMANVFAQLKQNQSPKEDEEETKPSLVGGGGGGGMANVFAQLKKTNKPKKTRSHSNHKKDASIYDMKTMETILPFMDALSEGEQYMCYILHVPRFEDRIKTMIFKYNFKNRIESIQEECKILTSSCSALKRSEKLKKVLKTVLQLGNKANASDKQGDSASVATAITVESLLALSTVKSFLDKKTTMMQYLVTVLKHNNPIILNFYEDFQDVCLLASRIDLKCLMTEINSLKTDAELAETFKKDCQDNINNKQNNNNINNDLNNEEEDSYESLLFFLNSTMNESIQSTQTNVELSHAQFKALLDYFLEPDPTMDPMRFFSTLLKFTKEFKDAKTTVEKMQQMKAAENRRLAMKKPPR